jgi:hypothetical protein
MKNEIRINPRNSVILVMDQTVGEVPETMNNRLVAATKTCVAIGTLSEFDGETRITLSHNIEEIECSKYKVFEGFLDTPSKKISICSILDEPLLECNVPGTPTKIFVWANDEFEPDDIQVIVNK